MPRTPCTPCRAATKRAAARGRGCARRLARAPSAPRQHRGRSGWCRRRPHRRLPPALRQTGHPQPPRRTPARRSASR
eukprot:5508825-Prymnesium_polylepis.2